MTRIRDVALVSLAFLLGAAASPSAHHAFSGQYDRNQPIRLSGTVTAVEWTNPHIAFSLQVKARNGTLAEWTFSGASAATLTRQGVAATTLKVGEVIRVDGFRALDGSRHAAAGAVTLPGGKRVFLAPLEEQTPI